MTKNKPVKYARFIYGKNIRTASEFVYFYDFLFFFFYIRCAGVCILNITYLVRHHVDIDTNVIWPRMYEQQPQKSFTLKNKYNLATRNTFTNIVSPNPDLNNKELTSACKRMQIIQVAYRSCTVFGYNFISCFMHNLFQISMLKARLISFSLGVTQTVTFF